MNLAAILALLNGLLPVLEAGVGLFIHNPVSQGKFAVTVGDINTIATVASAATSAVVSQVAGAESTVKVN